MLRKRLELDKPAVARILTKNLILFVGLTLGLETPGSESFMSWDPLLQFHYAFLPVDFNSVRIYTLSAKFCYMISSCNTWYTPICTWCATLTVIHSLDKNFMVLLHHLNYFSQQGKNNFCCTILVISMYLIRRIVLNNVLGIEVFLKVEMWSFLPLFFFFFLVFIFFWSH